MAYEKVLERFQDAYTADPKILCERGKEDQTFGSNPQYLEEVLSLSKSDLIRLQRLGYATKARYVTRNPRNVSYFKDAEGNPIPVDGPHRVRWLLFKEAV